MVTGIGITMYYACQDLPSISERNYVASLRQIPLFFGTAIFAFEGISLVLPLQNAMKVSENFHKHTGVLNVGMTVVTIIFTMFGFIGYLKYGEDVQGSLTLNLPPGDM
jgi:solute carrier family 36 (proton-coupled amino acid transporter)